MKYLVDIEQRRFFVNGECSFRFKTKEDRLAMKIIKDAESLCLDQVWIKRNTIHNVYRVPKNVLEQIMELIRRDDGSVETIE